LAKIARKIFFHNIYLSLNIKSLSLYKLSCLIAVETAEKKFSKTSRFELFTGFKSEKNLYLYKKIGYREFKEEQVNGMIIKYLEKCVSR